MSAPETYYDVAMRRLDRQAGLIDALDAKARAVLAAASALVPIFGAVFAAFGKTHPPKASVVLYVIAFGFYLVMVFFVWRATRVSEWSIRPELATLADHAKKQDETTVKLWVASECAKAVFTNKPRLKRKADYVDLSVVWLVVVTVLLSVAALIPLTTQ
jgi:hypothetical protein